MAELDTFFARRDKKKASGRRSKPPGLHNPTQPDGNLLETDGAPRRHRTEQPGEDDGDEWRVECEDKKDYTGLKLQPLILPESDESDEDADVGKNNPSGPWKIADISCPDDQSPDCLQSISSLNAGVYVTPRERMIASPVTLAPMTSRTAPPDVKSTVVFPSLAQADKTGGLRSNQSVWNRSHPGSDPRTQPCQQVDTSATIEPRRFAARSNTERTGQNSWRTLPPKDVQVGSNESWRVHTHEANNEKSKGRMNDDKTKENWRVNNERPNNRIKGDSWGNHTEDSATNSEKCNHSEIDNQKFSDIYSADNGISSRSPRTDSLKMGKYMPPNMRHKLTTGGGN